MTDSSLPFPLTILHLVSSERWTGVADPVVSLAREQAKMGHDVWLACIGGYTFEEKARESGVRVFSELTLDRRLHPPNIYADFKRLRDFVAERKVHITHSHLLHDNWLAASSLRKFKEPHLLMRTMHRFEWPRRDPMHKYLWRRRTDHIITTSDAMRERILSRLGLAADRVDVVNGGADLKRFNPSLDRDFMRAKYDIPLDAPVAGIVARLRDGRGHRWLLEAIPRVLEQSPDAHFLIVGRGELKYPLRAEVAASPHADRIHMTGYLSDTLPEAYSAMTCSLFLGLGSEGTCRAILEGMACARAVIGVDAGGVSEIVEQDKTGLIVDPDDVEGLAGAIASVLNDPTRASQLGNSGRQRCEERYTERVRADEIQQIYTKAWRRKNG